MITIHQSQTDGQTDGQTTCDRNTVLCAKVHCAVKTFHRQVTSLSETIRRMGSPFLDDFPELVTLDSCICADESVVATVCTLDDTDKKQYHHCDKNVLDERMTQSRRIL